MATRNPSPAKTIGIPSYIFLYEVSVIESTSGRAKRARWLFSGLVVDPSFRLIPDQSTSHLFCLSSSLRDASLLQPWSQGARAKAK